MIKKYLTVLSTTALIGVAPYALANSTADVHVAGTINPPACVPTFSEGGIINHGDISSKDLNADTTTRLPVEKLVMQVNCEAPQTLWLSAIDNKPGTSIDPGYKFGLGFINGDQKLGGFEPRFSSAVADGSAVSGIISYNNGATWNRTPAMRPNAITAFSTPGSAVPIPIKNLIADFLLYTSIAPTSTLDLTRPQRIQGHVTINIHY